jgi:DNA-binding IclR family transcriptional regulator
MVHRIPDSGTGLQTVDRAVRTLAVLREAAKPLQLRQIAALMQLSAPTAHRILASLMAHDWVEQDPHTRAYRLGFGLLPYAEKLRSSDLVSVTTVMAKDIRDACGETVTVQVKSGINRVVIQEVEGTHQMRRHVGVGNTLPLYTSASGRAMLAFLDPEEIEHVLGGELVARTKGSTVDRKKLLRFLEDIRSSGVAYSSDESELGVSAMAVPIFGADGQIAASVAVSGPASRWPSVCTPGFTSLVLALAERTSAELGFVGVMPWEQGEITAQPKNARGA